jgi:hypothetical protein
MERWVERVSEGVGVESKITLRGGKGAVVDEYDHVNAQSITRCSSSCGPANGPFDKQRRNICVMLRLFGLSRSIHTHLVLEQPLHFRRAALGFPHHEHRYSST